MKIEITLVGDSTLPRQLFTIFARLIGDINDGVEKGNVYHGDNYCGYYRITGEDTK